MKKLTLSVRYLLLLLGSLALVFFLLGHYLPPWFNRVSGRDASMNSTYYVQTVGLHARGDKLQPDDLIVFLGDSLTQALPVAAITPIGLNYGIGTDTTRGLLERLPVYSSLSRSRAVILAIGTNDLQINDTAAVLNRYEKILAGLPKKPEIICTAVLPVKVSAMQYPGTITMQRIENFNTSLKTLCEKHDHHFIDFPVELMDGNGELHTTYDDDDGVHLNSAGNMKWVQHLRKELQSLGLPVNLPDQ